MNTHFSLLSTLRPALCAALLCFGPAPARAVSNLVAVSAAVTVDTNKNISVSNIFFEPYLTIVRSNRMGQANPVGSLCLSNDFYLTFRGIQGTNQEPVAPGGIVFYGAVTASNLTHQITVTTTNYDSLSAPIYITNEAAVFAAAREMSTSNGVVLKIPLRNPAGWFKAYTHGYDWGRSAPVTTDGTYLFVGTGLGRNTPVAELVYDGGVFSLVTSLGNYAPTNQVFKFNPTTWALAASQIWTNAGGIRAASYTGSGVLFASANGALGLFNRYLTNAPLEVVAAVRFPAPAMLQQSNRLWVLGEGTDFLHVEPNASLIGGFSGPRLFMPRGGGIFAADTGYAYAAGGDGSITRWWLWDPATNQPQRALGKLPAGLKAAAIITTSDGRAFAACHGSNAPLLEFTMASLAIQQPTSYTDSPRLFPGKMRVQSINGVNLSSRSYPAGEDSGLLIYPEEGGASSCLEINERHKLSDYALADGGSRSFTNLIAVPYAGGTRAAWLNGCTLISGGLQVSGNATNWNLRVSTNLVLATATTNALLFSGYGGAVSAATLGTNGLVWSGGQLSLPSTNELLISALFATNLHLNLGADRGLGQLNVGGPIALYNASLRGQGNYAWAWRDNANGTNMEIQYWNGGTNYVSILKADTAGNLGLGTTNLYSGSKLSVVGGATFAANVRVLNLASNRVVATDSGTNLVSLPAGLSTSLTLYTHNAAGSALITNTITITNGLITGWTQ